MSDRAKGQATERSAEQQAYEDCGFRERAERLVDVLSGLVSISEQVADCIREQTDEGVSRFGDATKYRLYREVARARAALAAWDAEQ